MEHCEGICITRHGVKRKAIGRRNFCGIALCDYELNRTFNDGSLIAEQCDKCFSGRNFLGNKEKES